MSFEVTTPILCSPFAEPNVHWVLRTGEPPVQRSGRRPAVVFQPRSARTEWDTGDGELLAKHDEQERAYLLPLVNRLRDAVREWRAAGWPGVTAVTRELLEHWHDPAREQRLFFAQREAAETVIFLVEARADFRHGLDVPLDAPTDAQRAAGAVPLRRYACKMATGAGKTTVMALLSSWSIINKVTDRTRAEFADAVLVVCPNVTIRDRLRELDPQLGDASLYRTRDLVPDRLFPLLMRGRVLVTNWHAFEPKQATVGEVSARVLRTGVREVRKERVFIGDNTGVRRGMRYMTRADFERHVNAELFAEIADLQVDGEGALVSALVTWERWRESDEAVLRRVLGRELAGKRNFLVFNDEAHHAYRIQPVTDDDEDEDELALGDDELEEFTREATVWVEGLDRLNAKRGIACVVDLSATPYWLARMGRDVGRPFPWVVSDFGLVDAIESGMVKIPQLPVGDGTGGDRPRYFNLWQWVKEELDRRGHAGGRAGPTPERVLQVADVPLRMLAAEYSRTLDAWASERRDDPRPPVFIVVCKDTKLASLVHRWLAEDFESGQIPQANLPWFRNAPGRTVTIRVDTKVVAETDRGDTSAGDEQRWMRFTLDTVGRTSWPLERATGRPIMPPGFAELAEKLGRPLDPPGRDVRCIVSVGMLTEGWDANTVTHVVGLRPFTSQLLCEQVVGRALRRVSYDPDPETGLLREEVAQVLGVPFEVIPFKATTATPVQPTQRFHVRAIPERAAMAIAFPRVEWYLQARRARIRMAWDRAQSTVIRYDEAPTVVRMGALQPGETGGPAAKPVGRVSEVRLAAYRTKTRLQAVAFEIAANVTSRLVSRDGDGRIGAAYALFPQVLSVVNLYLRDFVSCESGMEIIDAGVNPFFARIAERIEAAIEADTGGEAPPERPRLDRWQPEGTTSAVDWWTSRKVTPTRKSHVNLAVLDSSWEKTAAEALDAPRWDPVVACWVKNAGLGLTIPYEVEGERRAYIPDFVVRLIGESPQFMLLEVKGGLDQFAEHKAAAARRWCSAVTADGRWGTWEYEVARSTADVSAILLDRLGRRGLFASS